MQGLEIVDDPDVPGVVRIARSPEMPGPRVGILGAIHGNERCGLEVIRRLRAAAEAGELPLARGTLVLVHGNPLASAAGARTSGGGADINRILDDAFVETPPESSGRPSTIGPSPCAPSSGNSTSCSTCTRRARRPSPSRSSTPCRPRWVWPRPSACAG